MLVAVVIVGIFGVAAGGEDGKVTTVGKRWGWLAYPSMERNGSSLGPQPLCPHGGCDCRHGRQLLSYTLCDEKENHESHIILISFDGWT
mmetsp:Transcript_5890/g.12300  ORF Transcript_5890/g.12300 Transcript_5890/m.12300 type:complete len:89 (-) Transcript_5890:3-269(-)